LYLRHENHSESLPLTAVVLAHNGKWIEAEAKMNNSLDLINLNPHRYYDLWVHTDVPLFIKMAEESGHADIAARIRKRFQSMKWQAKTEDKRWTDDVIIRKFGPAD
jgi:hypothetical protein